MLRTDRNGNAFRIPEEEYVWILKTLRRDLLRNPRLDRLDNAKLAHLADHWDDIFARWLRRFYRPLGIEVRADPESDAAISFIPLPIEGIEVQAVPDDLGPAGIDSKLANRWIRRWGRDMVAVLYLHTRLSQVFEASQTEGVQLPPPFYPSEYLQYLSERG